MNAHTRLPQTRPTFWIARNPETGEVTGYSTKNDAYQGFLDYGDDLDFYQIDPDGHCFEVGGDFGEANFANIRDAISMRQHERGLGDKGRFL